MKFWKKFSGLLKASDIWVNAEWHTESS